MYVGMELTCNGVIHIHRCIILILGELPDLHPTIAAVGLILEIEEYLLNIATALIGSCKMRRKTVMATYKTNYIVILADKIFPQLFGCCNRSISKLTNRVNTLRCKLSLACQMFVCH